MDNQVNLARIEQRNLHRRLAADLRNLIGEEIVKAGGQCQDIYEKMLHSLLPPPPEPASPQKPMTDAESRAFGLRVMPDKYHAHAGDRVDSVPLDYIHYVTERDDFAKDLRRYWMSARIQREQADD